MDIEKIAEIICGQGWANVAEASKYMYRNRADQILALFDVEAIKREERERIQGWLLQWEGLWDMKDIRLFYNQDMNRQSLRGE